MRKRVTLALPVREGMGAAEEAQHGGGGVAFAQRLASLSLLTVRLGQGRLSAMKEVNRRHFALGHHADWLRVLPG